jgi:hypothetical protein
MPLSNFQLHTLALGGSDGGKEQSSADSAVTGLACHLLQVTSDTVFTVLTGVDADGDDVNMLTTNNLTGKTVSAPATLGCPDLNKGGYIKAITMTSGQILRHTLPDTARGN